MTKCRILFTGILLALIILVIILILNYIAFLEEENRIFLTNINNNIVQLQMKIEALESKRDSQPAAIRPGQGNRGFMIKKSDSPQVVR